MLIDFAALQKKKKKKHFLSRNEENLTAGLQFQPAWACIINVASREMSALYQKEAAY